MRNCFRRLPSFLSPRVRRLFCLRATWSTLCVPQRFRKQDRHHATERSVHRSRIKTGIPSSTRAELWVSVSSFLSVILFYTDGEVQRRTLAGDVLLKWQQQVLRIRTMACMYWILDHHLRRWNVAEIGTLLWGRFLGACWQWQTILGLGVGEVLVQRRASFNICGASSMEKAEAIAEDQQLTNSRFPCLDFEDALTAISETSDNTPRANSSKKNMMGRWSTLKKK